MRVRLAAFKELPSGTGLTVRHGQHEIALFRVGDQVYALENTCPHLEAPLAEGYLAGNLVSCPYHAWEICVRTGRVQHNPELCANTYPVEIENGEIYVTF